MQTVEDLSTVVDTERHTPLLHTLRTLIFTPAMNPGGEDQLARLGCAPTAFSTSVINRGEYFSLDQLTGACDKHDFAQPRERGF